MFDIQTLILAAGLKTVYHNRKNPLTSEVRGSNTEKTTVEQEKMEVVPKPSEQENQITPTSTAGKVHEIKEQESTTSQDFMKSLRTTATKESYGYALEKVFLNNGMDPNSFLELCQKDRKKAESYLLNWIVDAQEKLHLRGCSIRTYLAAVKSLHDFAEVSPPLNWKKIKAAPRLSKSQDRPLHQKRKN
jgi:hypothetical protein